MLSKNKGYKTYTGHETRVLSYANNRDTQHKRGNSITLAKVMWMLEQLSGIEDTKQAVVCD